MARKPSADLDQPEMSDAVRRRDQAEPDAPGMVPCPSENVKIGGVSPSEDGGVGSIRSTTTTSKILAPRTMKN
ncbi:MAG: hypothetical protein ABWY66_05030 [Xanthobacteraceae bacterium]